MTIATPPDDKKAAREQGFALILVLWVIVALGVEIALLNSSVGDLTRLATNEGAIVQGEALARSAVEVAAARLLSADDRERWNGDGGRRMVSFPNAQVFVRISDENGKVNLNLADPQMLSRLLAVVTGSQKEAEAMTTRLVTWRQGKKDKRVVGTPTSSAAPSSAGAQLADERPPLLLDAADFAKVTGASPEVMTALLPHVTIFTGEGRINPTYASEQVLRALPNLSATNLEKLLKLRRGGPNDDETVASLLREARPYLSNRRGPAYRLDVSMDRRATTAIGHAVAIIQLSLDAEAPFRVLSWHFEAANVPDASERRAGGTNSGQNPSSPRP